MNKEPVLGKYGAVIQKARSQDQNTEKPENQLSGLPEGAEVKEEEVNLSIKVSKRLRRHWVAEAKRRDTSLTAVVIAALLEKLGEPDNC